MTRRRFHIAMTYGLGAIMGLIAGAIGFVYLLVLPKPRGEDEWVEAADLTSLPQDVPEEVVYSRRRIDGWKVTVEKAKAWIVRKPGDQVVAFAPQCTHLGCAYHWDNKAGSFLCPCHSSRFSLDGSVLSGPAPRPLDQFAVRIDAGKVSLGAARKQA